MLSFIGTYGAIHIKYECEKCGAEDNYSQVISFTYSNSRGNRIGEGPKAENYSEGLDLAEKEKDRMLSTYRGINARKCPKCGRYQTWMSSGLTGRIEKLLAVLLWAVAGMIWSIYLFNHTWRLSTDLIANDLLTDSIVKGAFYSLIAAVVFYAAVHIINMVIYEQRDLPKLKQLKKTPEMVWIR